MDIGRLQGETVQNFSLGQVPGAPRYVIFEGRGCRCKGWPFARSPRGSPRISLVHCLHRPTANKRDVHPALYVISQRGEIVIFYRSCTTALVSKRQAFLSPEQT